MTGRVKLNRRIIINGIFSAILALFLLYMITPVFHLSGALRYTIMFVLCTCISLVVTLKPRWVLWTVCLFLLFIGLALIFLSQSEELLSQINWNPSMLGAGVSTMALAIAFYILALERRQVEERQLTNSSKLPKEGYVYLEDVEKYRCEHCLHFGKYRYYKTLIGIKRHITRNHS